jgi:hypothetical protein
MFEIRDAVRLVSGREAHRHETSAALRWTHDGLLMQVEDPTAREWGMPQGRKQSPRLIHVATRT